MQPEIDKLLEYGIVKADNDDDDEKWYDYQHYPEEEPDNADDVDHESDTVLLAAAKRFRLTGLRQLLED